MTRPFDSPLRTLLEPVVRENPITLQVLGVCSALAVTRSVATALANLRHSSVDRIELCH